MHTAELGIVSRRRGRVSIGLVAALVVGCGTSAGSSALSPSSAPLSASSSPDHTDVAAPSVTSSPSPPSPSEATGELPHDSVAQVVTTDLVIRSQPGIQAGSEIYPVRLNEPTLLYVLDGPVRASGYDWYQVQPFEVGVCMDICPERPPVGWVAQAAQDGEAWVAPGSVSCPPPSVAEVQWLSAVARLACFRNESLVLRGKLGSCFAPAGALIPAMLAEGCMLYTDDYEPPVDTFGEPGIKLRYGGTTGMSQDGHATPLPMLGGEHVRVTGQFDHPDANDCGRDSQVVLLCRGEFVVSEVIVRN
jgi:hypothetical protein